MRLTRFLPLLVLCCVLDLAVPVAPTATGVEFEDDEEVVSLGGWRLPRPAATRPPRRDEVAQRRTAQPGAQIARRPQRTTPLAAPRLHLAAAEPSLSPPSGEDH